METYGSTMERGRWTDERIDERMNAIDQTFERIFEEMRAMRTDLTAEMRAMRSDLTAEMRAMRGDLTAEITATRRDVTADLTAQRGDIASLAGRVDRIQDRLVQIGFGMTSVFAAGLIALVATQL